MEKFEYGKILPAVTIINESTAKLLAQAILKGGIRVMEVTFRNKHAAKAIEIICKEVPEMITGAGTILTIKDLHTAKEAGAMFGLAPGLNPPIIQEAVKIGLPFIPGVATPSEIEKALEMGCEVLKIYPIEQLGGISYLKALHGPYGHKKIQFIPMGGINNSNILSYLEMEDVVAVGGSWLTPKNLVLGNNGETLTREVRATINMIENSL